MKKSLLLISALFLGAFGAKAQITLTMADVASPVTVVQQAHDTLPTVMPGAAGTSQTWNFTALNSHTIDTITFITNTWGPSYTSFPGANLAAKFNSQGQVGHAYLSKTSSGLTIIGNHGIQDFGGGPDTIIQKNTPAEILVNFPSTYLSNFNNNFTTDATFYFGIDPGIGFTIDSIRQKSVISKTSNIDAWGTISTPLLTAGDAALRFYNVKQSIDSVWAYAFGSWTFVQETKDTTYQYSWWGQNHGFPLVEMDVDSAGNPISVQWLMVAPTAGIDESAPLAEVNVYPNPAQNDITFAVEQGKAVAVQVYDIAGRMIDSYPITGDKLTINTGNFANGVYSYSLIGKDKAIVNKGNFTVAK